MRPLDGLEAAGARSVGQKLLVARKRVHAPYGAPVPVGHVSFDFRQWDGPMGDWQENFGKGRGQVYSLDGRAPERSCNEIEVAKRLRTIRDHAYWFSGYNPRAAPEIWQPWMRSLKDERSSWLVDLDERIRARIRSRTGGMPDVVAWNDEQALQSALFVECKGPGESFSEAQEDWAWAACEEGIRPSQLVVSLRSF